MREPHYRMENRHVVHISLLFPQENIFASPGIKVLDTICRRKKWQTLGNIVYRQSDGS